MIIWLASYPKSGNTWIRSFIHTLLYTKDKKPNFNKLKIINQFPIKSQFKNFLSDYSDPKNVAKFWIKSQNLINSDKKIKFLKTHHIMCELNGHKFTNLNNALGVIHIVRDPRNLITSLKNHYSKSNYYECLEFIFDKHHAIDVENNTHHGIKKENILSTIISSWNNHYNSWKVFPRNYILIKYEDLVNDTDNTFFKLKGYLEDCCKIKIKDSDVITSIKNNEFQNLKNIESIDGFNESSFDQDKKQKKEFFYLGPSNNWREILPNEIKIAIEEKFNKEMKELGYI
jgi:hypothetical protein